MSFFAASCYFIPSGVSVPKRLFCFYFTPESDIFAPHQIKLLKKKTEMTGAPPRSQGRESGGWAVSVGGKIMRPEKGGGERKSREVSSVMGRAGGGRGKERREERGRRDEGEEGGEKVERREDRRWRKGGEG